MATSNEPLQLNLGSLRSAMSLTLHTTRSPSGTAAPPPKGDPASSA
jgi:hypothetical protein